MILQAIVKEIVISWILESTFSPEKSMSLFEDMWYYFN